MFTASSVSFFFYNLSEAEKTSKLQFAIFQASLIFKNKFSDAVSNLQRGKSCPHRALGHIKQHQCKQFKFHSHKK